MSLLSFAQTYSDPSYFTTALNENSTASISTPTIILLSALWLALVVLMVVILWKVYKKTGRPGWAAIVPVYNAWVLFEIVGYPGWWALLSFVPLVNVFPAIMMLVAYYQLAKLFGKSTGFAVCNVIFPIVTMPILAFGKATFQGTPAPAPTEAAVAPIQPNAVPESPAVVAPTPPAAPAAFAEPTPEELEAVEEPEVPKNPQGPLVQ